MKKIKQLHKAIVIGVSVVSLGLGVGGCAKTQESKAGIEKAVSSNNTVNVESAKPVTLTMLIHDDAQYEYFTETSSISDAFKEVMPNVTIEIEKVKNTEDLENTLKLRKSADELPDIMVLKPYMLANFAEALEPLNNTTAVTSNLYAKEYEIDNNIYGVPETIFYEFVYYRKSIFEKYGLEVPKTWDEFIETAQTIKEKNEHIPILLGAKDAWPNYPFNEFMPGIEAENGAYWNEMATKEEPFSPGEPFYEAYVKIQKLYDTQVFGRDPLGIGFDQAKNMFVAGEGAMLPAGQWFITDYEGSGGDMEDLGLFLMPARNTQADTFYSMAVVDLFYATPKSSENVELVKQFIDWYFSSQYLKGCMEQRGIDTTTNNVDIELPILDSVQNAEDAKYLLYDGGNIEFQKIVNSFGFDVKKIGQDMLAGADFDSMMKKLNDQWKKGKNN